MKAQGLARIGKDAELKYTPSGDAVINISLAFTYGKKGTDGNRLTQWVDGSLWGKRAESLAPYIKKGNQVVAYLDDLCVEEYNKKDGNHGSKLVGRISDIELISTKSPEFENKEAPKPKPAPQVGFDDLDEPPF